MFQWYFPKEIVTGLVEGTAIGVGAEQSAQLVGCFGNVVF